MGDTDPCTAALRYHCFTFLAMLLSVSILSDLYILVNYNNIRPYMLSIQTWCSDDFESGCIFVASRVPTNVVPCGKAARLSIISILYQFHLNYAIDTIYGPYMAQSCLRRSKNAITVSQFTDALQRTWLESRGFRQGRIPALPSRLG